MKATKVLVVSGLAITMLAAITAPVFATEEPTTTIKKSVQNQTTNGALSDANTLNDAVTVKTGDILKYVIEIKNNADKSDEDKNTLSSGKLVDGLPAGVELVSDPSKREVTEDFGTIKPGDTITKQFLVKVTAGKDGEAIENRGCFTGQYAQQNKPVSSCESAFVKVSLGGNTTPTPAPVEEKPEATKPEEPADKPAAVAPAETSAPKGDLPTTGPSDVIAPLAAVSTGALAYAGRLLYLKRTQH
ncbi:MAG TPA: hypothetical protein VD735_04935 [Candidatus Saccharimonadales bacterium]|nr:hypothetical protein [Candidatus Saccharimonadales bacterium]